MVINKCIFLDKTGFGSKLLSSGQHVMPERLMVIGRSQDACISNQNSLRHKRITINERRLSITSAILNHGAISGHSFTMALQGLYFQSFSIRLACILWTRCMLSTWRPLCVTELDLRAVLSCVVQKALIKVLTTFKYGLLMGYHY